MESTNQLTLHGKLCRLRPVMPDDLEFLYSLSTCEENGFRWRYRGAFPDPSSFARDHNAGTLLQLIVVAAKSKERVGIVNLYGENLRDGWAYLGAVAAPEFRDTGIVIDGAATLLDYAFSLWAFRKIYLETIEYNLSQFEVGLRRVAIEEGRLVDHVFFEDRYWDVATSAIYRESWRSYRSAQQRVARRTQDHARDFGGLMNQLAAELEMDVGPPNMRLIEDLGFDSLRMTELIVAVCDLAKVPDPDELPELRTLQDVHDWYLSLERGLRPPEDHVGTSSRIGS